MFSSGGFSFFLKRGKCTYDLVYLFSSFCFKEFDSRDCFLTHRMQFLSHRMSFLSLNVIYRVCIFSTSCQKVHEYVVLP